MGETLFAENSVTGQFDISGNPAIYMLTPVLFLTFIKGFSVTMLLVRSGSAD